MGFPSRDRQLIAGWCTSSEWRPFSCWKGISGWRPACNSAQTSAGSKQDATHLLRIVTHTRPHCSHQVILVILVILVVIPRHPRLRSGISAPEVLALQVMSSPVASLPEVSCLPFLWFFRSMWGGKEHSRHAMTFLMWKALNESRFQG